MGIVDEEEATQLQAINAILKKKGCQRDTTELEPMVATTRLELLYAFSASSLVIALPSVEPNWPIESSAEAAPGEWMRSKRLTDRPARIL